MHVIIGEAHMMPYLMHENMGDEMAERFIIFCPVIKHRPAIEKHHMGHMERIGHGAVEMRNALIETEQIERAFKLHLGGNLIIGKILDVDEKPLTARTETFRQAGKS